MGNIVLLDDLTINKIAAGEVIERPSSVIKEMVENSIDAGANNITVEIKNGGISFIKVTDNGKGIAQDDLEIAFERHATSKIRTADDLDVVTSMGFRGEALASIAAIANVEMVSKTEEQQVGYKVVVEAGDILSKEEIGCQKGTSITVRNLFFNTPVRYKFLKKDYTESGYIEDVITRIALVNPNIAIKLINTGKTVIQTNGNGDIKSVIYSIYGKDVATGVMPVEYAYDDIQVSGVIGKPEIARSNRSNQLFFVNKRYIKDKTLSAATEQAYKGLIPIGKFGFVVLNITMNPAKVDVNVHPAKLEVRFEDESKIFQSIYHAIKDTLLKGELVASTEKQEINQNKEEVSKGLYDFRKNETEKIEQYTNEESKIKTNNIVQDIYNKAQQNVQTQAVKVPHVNLGEGGPVNTADVLEQLKKLQENIQKEVETDPSIKLNSNYIQMREQQGNQTKVETSIENDEVKVENNTDTENTNIQEQKIETPTEIKENTETEIEENAQIDNTKSNEIKPEDKLEEIQQEEAKPAESFDEMYAKLFGTKPISQEQIETKSNLQEEVIPIKPEIPSIDMKKENVSIFEQNEENQKPTYKFIGIVFNTYIILEIDKEMYILDQHAAHERIMYEKVKNNYYSDSSKDSQMLLLPDIITLTHKEMEIAKDNMEMFKKAGFSLEEFGENTIKLTGVPTVCIDLDNKELFLETLDEINTVARTAKQEKEERFIATVACKAAVKANMVLTREEVESLMDKLLALPNPFTCPHGRPTAIKMSKYDIERKFARK
jgi:DNA mismatch repair protein MutL